MAAKKKKSSPKFKVPVAVPGFHILTYTEDGETHSPTFHTLEHAANLITLLDQREIPYLHTAPAE